MSSDYLIQSRPSVVSIFSVVDADVKTSLEFRRRCVEVSLLLSYATRWCLIPEVNEKQSISNESRTQSATFLTYRTVGLSHCVNLAM